MNQSAPGIIDAPAATCTAFVVRRDDLKQTKFTHTALPTEGNLRDGGLLLQVERFAFTANNITYAMLGDQLKYWHLFPAPEGYGNIPVWGFGRVVASRHSDVAVGERLFGYLPMASHLVIEAADVSRRGLRDAAAHRADVAPVYNAYARVTGNDTYEGRNGDYQALLRPLFMLSFLVDDFLAENEFFGAGTVILSSASSKTAFGLANLIHLERKPIRIIGLTSGGNAAFVRALGCYDDVVDYADVGSLPADRPAVFIDMAGNGKLRAQIHQRLGAQLKHSGRIGLTHQDMAAEESGLPGPAPTWFFAPDQIRKRAKEWGPGGIETRFDQAWRGLVPLLDRALTVTEEHGPDAVARRYQATLNGTVPPNEGLILTF